MTEKESATFLKVCEVLKGCTLEEVKKICDAIEEILEYHDFENIERFAEVVSSICGIKKESGASFKEILDIIEKTLAIVNLDRKGGDEVVGFDK